MSLKRNIGFNYLSQMYVTVIGILLVPVYVRSMGAEAYGLVGFFALLQSWFGMLDLGLTPTISRETARYKGGALSSHTFRQLFRSLSIIFVGVAVVGGGVLLILSEEISGRWLKVETLSKSDVIIAVEIMAISVALRWVGGLHRGVVIGSERMGWMSSFNALIATLRFAGVLMSMHLFGYSVVVFFWHQLVVAIVELCGLFFMSRRLLPSIDYQRDKIRWSLQPVVPFLRFSLSIALTSSIWILVTQLDKLVLSGLLPLSEYGNFTVAVLAASGVTIISGPISNAIMPRMSRLHAEGNNDELLRVYRSSTRFVSAVAGSVAIALAFCAKPVLYAWTGNYELATSTSAILTLYALGNAVLAMTAFPYYLQYARGNLRYHVQGHVAMVLITVPATVFGAMQFGGLGAGVAWLGVNAVYLFCWVAYVHKKLQPQLHLSWLCNDVLAVVLPAVIVASAINNFWPVSEFANPDSSRLDVGAKVMSFSFVVLMCSLGMYRALGKNGQ